MQDHIEVSGTGSASAVPDVVRVHVGVRCDGDSVSAALADAGSRAAGIGQAARDHGVVDTDIRTTGTGVHPRHDRDGERVLGYTAVHSLVVTVRDTARVSSLVDAFAGAAGDALTVDHIGLEIGEPEPVLARARQAAFEDARTKAEQYAALSGRRLGKVQRVRDVVDSGTQPRYELMAAAKVAGVELGENTVTASVAVRWEWN